MKPIKMLLWLIKNGDRTYRINHDLNKDSIVFDVGAYHGQFTRDITDKYDCFVYAFEPVKNSFNVLKKKFKHNKKVKVFQIGLSDRTKKTFIKFDDDGSSLYKDYGEDEPIILKDIFEFINKKKIKEIDLMEINIEGEEYDLLDYLIDTGGVEKVKNIQIQFHNYLSDYKSRRRWIVSRLKRTHERTYNFPFIRENWKRIS